MGWFWFITIFFQEKCWERWFGFNFYETISPTKQLKSNLCIPQLTQLWITLAYIFAQKTEFTDFAEM